MRRRWTAPAPAWAALVCALWLCVAPPLAGHLAAGPSPPAWAKRSAPHFDLYFNASPERTQQTGAESALAEVYGAAVGGRHRLLCSDRPEPETAPAWTVNRPQDQEAATRFQPAELAPWEVPLLQTDVFAILGRQDVAATA